VALTAGEINILVKARDDASRTLGRIGRAGGAMGGAVRAGAMIGVAGVAALGVAAIRFASDFDNAYNTIRRGTGATGDALEALKEDFRETFRGVPDSMADVATATADLNTRLGLTGPPLQAMTRQFLDLARVAEVDVATAIAAGTRVFGDWAIATEDQTDALDHMWRVSQTTGIGVDSLAQKVVQFGAPLRQFGFGFEEATVLLGAWEREGVNTEAILGALKIGVANFARENIDAVTGLEDFIAELTELGPGAEATARAIEIFGSRAGPDMAAAVTEGRFAIEDLMGIIESSPETIAAAAEETLTWQDKLGRLRNEILVRVEPALIAMTDKAEEFSDWLADEGLPKAEAFIESLQPFVPVLEGIWDSFRLGIETIRPPVEWLFNFVIDNKPMMVAAILAIGAAIALAFGPYAIAIVALLGLILVIGWVRDNWEMLKEETMRILGIVTDFIDEKMGIWDEIIVGAITTIVSFIRENWETIQSIIQGALDLIVLNITDQLTFIRDLFRLVFAIFQGDWGLAWDILKGIVTDRLEFMRQRIAIILGIYKDLFRLAWAAIRDIATFAWAAIVGVVTGALGRMRDVFVFSLATFVGFWADLPDRILNALGDLGNLLFDAGRQIIQGLIDGINAMLPSIPDLTPGFDVPGIPLFHQGGIVPGHPGQQMLSVLEAGERIIPANRVAASAGDGVGGGIVQNIYVTVEDRSPAAIAHAVEMAGMELGERLAMEGV
jgi:TP901 family phage tail tape measure protein